VALRDLQDFRLYRAGIGIDIDQGYSPSRGISRQKGDLADQATAVVWSSIVAPGEFFLMDSIAAMAEALAEYPSDENMFCPFGALKRNRNSPFLSL
jgi:hypothetical protein